MNAPILFSDCIAPFDWSDAASYKIDYGPKGTLLATLPRAWTLPFALISASILIDPASLLALEPEFLSRIRSLAASDYKLIVRSSIVGESIWDRGTYESIELAATPDDFPRRLSDAARRIKASATGKSTGLVIQRFVSPRSRGEFGNLLRISKTRDHWELSTELPGFGTSRSRFNTQRDEAASPDVGLSIRSRQTPERLFGSIAAWLNSYLLRGRGQRLNCEWISDQRQFFLVQIDEEDEDLSGVNRKRSFDRTALWA